MWSLSPSGSQYFAVRDFTMCWVLVIAAWCESGCANVKSAPGPPAPPPGKAVSISIKPANASVLLGGQLTFTATVKNTTDATVSWSVNGAAGGAAQTGTITGAGVYTAPVDLPVPASVQVTATSHADSAKSASATVIIKSDVAVTVGSGTATVELGATRKFQSSVTSSGNADQAVVWDLSGPSCPLACGFVDASGNYTAPQILPAPANVTLTARSVADPTKLALTMITITSNFVLQLSGPTSVAAGGTATFLATMTPVPGSNPSAVLTWSLSGTGCAGASCGTLVVMNTQLTGSATVTSASYSAPLAAPSPNAIAVTVTPLADPSKAVQRLFSIQMTSSGGISVSISPATATRAVNHRITLTAQVSGTTNSNVAWTVGGIAGGNISVGQICVVNSSPCQPVTGSGSALQVDYLAPAALPALNPVTVQAASAADITKIGAAQITIINHVVVAVLPGSVTLPPLGVQGFTATVLGAENQTVVWQVQGAGCAGGGVCGVITPGGVYTAPAAPPASNALQVLAISSDDPSQSGIANVTIATGSNILTLHPASVYAGAANGFTLKVIGSGFSAPVSGGGSTLLIGGTARTTTCNAADECIAPVTAADVAQPGTVSVQVQDPDGKKSNAVVLVVEPPNVSDEVILLTAGVPAVAGRDTVVVEPTTAGVSVPGNNVDLNLAALGIFSVANNSCTLGGNPVALPRPASGVTTADVCLFSQSGLDPSMTFTVAGPGDVFVIAKQPLGLGIMRVTLQLPATAAASARTLFIQNTNLDKTAASGTLWVQ